MLHTHRERAKWLVLLFQQITVPCVTDFSSGHDRLLFTIECFGPVAQTLFEVWKYLRRFHSTCMSCIVHAAAGFFSSEKLFHSSDLF